MVINSKLVKICLTGPIQMPQGHKPLYLIHLWVITLFSYSAPSASSLPISRVIMNWTSQYKGHKFGTFCDKICLTGRKWSISNALRSEIPVSHSLMGDSLIFIFSPGPCCFLSFSLWGNKELDLPI